MSAQAIARYAVRAACDQAGMQQAVGARDGDRAVPSVARSAAGGARLRAREAARAKSQGCRQ